MELRLTYRSGTRGATHTHFLRSIRSNVTALHCTALHCTALHCVAFRVHCIPIPFHSPTRFALLTLVDVARVPRVDAAPVLHVALELALVQRAVRELEHALAVDVVVREPAVVARAAREAGRRADTVTPPPSVGG